MSSTSIQQEALALGLSGKELKRRKGLITSKTHFQSARHTPAPRQTSAEPQPTFAEAAE